MHFLGTLGLVGHNFAISSNSPLIGVSVGQLAFSNSISSTESVISVPDSESRIDAALDAPGMGMEVGN